MTSLLFALLTSQSCTASGLKSQDGLIPLAGINFILSSMVFNVVPTFLEVTMVAGILAYRCGPAFAALTAGTIAAYTAFTFAVTAVREPLIRTLLQ